MHLRCSCQSKCFHLRNPGVWCDMTKVIVIPMPKVMGFVNGSLIPPTGNIERVCLELSPCLIIPWQLWWVTNQFLYWISLGTDLYNLVQLPQNFWGEVLNHVRGATSCHTSMGAFSGGGVNPTRMSLHPPGALWFAISAAISIQAKCRTWKPPTPYLF